MRSPLPGPCPRSDVSLPCACSRRAFERARPRGGSACWFAESSCFSRAMTVFEVALAQVTQLLHVSVCVARPRRKTDQSRSIVEVGSFASPSVLTRAAEHKKDEPFFLENASCFVNHEPAPGQKASSRIQVIPPTFSSRLCYVACNQYGYSCLPVDASATSPPDSVLADR